MTIEEYLGHMCDRLMLQFSNRSEMPEMYDWVVMEVIQAAVEDLKQDYILVHKSHVSQRCQRDTVFNQHLVSTAMFAKVDAWIGQEEVDLAWGRLDVLDDEKQKQHRNLIKYLEAPKPTEEKRNDA